MSRAEFIVGFFVLSASTSLVAQVCEQCIQTIKPNCKIDQESTFTISGCSAYATASWDGTSATTKTQSCTATIPPAWMLINHKVVETSNNNGSYQVSKYAAGTDLEYRKIIDEAYLSALEVAGKIADETSRKEVEGKIKREYKDRVEFYEKLKTNKDTVKVEVTATAHGSPLDRKRGWEGVNVYLLVQCVAPLDLLDQVKDKYNLKTPELRNINSIKFQGSEVRETTKYFAWRGVDRFTDCNSTQGPISIVKIPFNTLGEVFVDQSMEICYSVLPTPSSVPKFSKDCRAKFGDSMALDNTPSSCVVN